MLRELLPGLARTAQCNLRVISKVVVLDGKIY